MRFLISIENTFELYSTALEEYVVRAMGFVNEDNSIDWLGYCHYCNERMLIMSAARQNSSVILAPIIRTSTEKTVRAMSDISARLKDMWLKRLREDSRAAQSEGRFISLMASMPVPPTRPALVSCNGWNNTTLI